MNIRKYYGAGLYHKSMGEDEKYEDKIRLQEIKYKVKEKLIDYINKECGYQQYTLKFTQEETQLILRDKCKEYEKYEERLYRILVEVSY